jgi:GDP-4-dehydro-6-deoxy-D-mannose reductase
MNVLVTGASGFLGRHVCASLKRAGADQQVVGLHDRTDTRLPNIDEIVRADVAEPEQLKRALNNREFNVCVHLAGALAGSSPEALFKTNVAGTANLVTAVARGGRLDRLVLVSSCAVYGNGSGDGDVDESTPLAPQSAYAESCIGREIAARLLGSGLFELVVLRVFNMVGPGQPATMMIPTVARQLARMQLGLQPEVLEVGRLDTLRDYVDVRDVADAIVKLTREPGPFPLLLNIGSGSCWSGSDILKMLLATAKLTPQVVIRERPIRSTDVLRIRNKSTLARTVLDWSPERPLAASVRDTLDDWLTRAAEEPR